MTSRFKTPALRRWLSLTLTLVVILAMAPAALAAATAPGIPSNLQAAPGIRQVALTWDAPANGGAAITDYGVQYRTVGGIWASFPDGTNPNTGATVTLLADGTTYQLRVRARNSVGWGLSSDYVTATTTAANVAPGIPQNLTRPRA